MKTISTVIVSVFGLLLFWYIAVPEFSGPGISGIFMRTMTEAKQVGLAAKLYAEDHQGRLPETLSQLTPEYLPNDDLFAQMQLTAPGAILNELPPTSIIATRTATDPKRKQTRIVIVRADISVTLERP